MPALGDFLGRLMADVIRARVQADLEVARVARMYGSDPLLRSLPVARFRLPTIDLSVPFMVTDAGQGRREVSLDQGKAEVIARLRWQLEQHGVVLTSDEMANISHRLDEVTSGLSEDLKAAGNVLLLAGELSDAVVAALPHRVAALDDQAGRFGNVVAGIRDAVRLTVLAIGAPADQLQVEVAAAQIAEVNPEALLRINLHLSEEGWGLTGGVDQPPRLAPE